jgi:hypothetical protein
MQDAHGCLISFGTSSQTHLLGITFALSFLAVKSAHSTSYVGTCTYQGAQLSLTLNSPGIDQLV